MTYIGTQLVIMSVELVKASWRELSRVDVVKLSGVEFRIG